MAALLSFPAPRVSDSALSRAIELEDAGKIEAAERLYLDILRTSGDARAAINLGAIAYGRRQYAMAEEMYRLATRTEPDYVMAWFNLGNALDELKRLPEAIEAYQKAVSLDPRYADAHFNLGMALERVGQGAQALKHWRAYVKLDPSGVSDEWARRRVRILAAESPLRCVHALGKATGYLYGPGRL